MDRPTIVRCVKSTPGLVYGRNYELLAVNHHIILGPLFKLGDLVTRRILEDEYYPWRFEIVRRGLVSE